MKNKWISLLVLLVACGCVQKDYGELRGECIDMYPSNYTAEEICFTQACGALSLEYQGSMSWYEATCDCYAKNGARIDVEVWSMDTDECEQVKENRLAIQTCCINKGVGY